MSKNEFTLSGLTPVTNANGQVESASMTDLTWEKM